MCLITIAPKGTDKQSDQFFTWLENGANNNDDGHGYCYKKAGSNKIYLKKGLFDIKDFIKEIRDLKLQPEDELIVHSRIGNVGNKTVDNCHPFVVSQDTDTIIMNEGFTKNPVIAHNGTFYDFKKTNDQYSDTHYFVKEILGIPEIKRLMQRDPHIFYSVVSKIVGGLNKVAFILPNIDMFWIGDFKKEDNYLFSNDGYKRSNFVNRGGVTHYPDYANNWLGEKAYYSENDDDLNNIYGYPRNKKKHNQLDVFTDFEDIGEHNIIGNSKSRYKNAANVPGFRPIFTNKELNLNSNNYEHFAFWIPDVDPSDKEKYFIGRDLPFLVYNPIITNPGLLSYSLVSDKFKKYSVQEELIKKICWFGPKKEYKPIYHKYWTLLEAMSANSKINRTPTGNALKKLSKSLVVKQGKLNNQGTEVEYQGKKYPIYAAILILKTFSSADLSKLSKDFINNHSELSIPVNIDFNNVTYDSSKALTLVKSDSKWDADIILGFLERKTCVLNSISTNARALELMDRYEGIDYREACFIISKYENPEKFGVNTDEDEPLTEFIEAEVLDDKELISDDED